MLSGLKQRLRRRLIGNRNIRLLDRLDRTVSILGNRHYLERSPELKAPGFNVPVTAHEFSCYSQNGEDGIILHLLDKVGVTCHSIIEIGTEDLRECNSANLIFNFGWNACLIEADAAWAARAKEYLASMQPAGNISFIHARAMPDDINGILGEAGYSGEVDVLSVDIDSYDYWLWQAIEICSPRIVVIEYNASFGPDLSVTVPSPEQGGMQDHGQPLYHGASITALQRLGERKGYRLVGGDSRGVNAFFVRQDLVDAAGLQPVSAGEAFRPHYRRSRNVSRQEQYRLATQPPLVTID